MKIKKNHFLKLMKVEFKTQITPVKLIIALILAFIPMITPMASNSDNYNQSVDQTWGLLGRVFTEATMNAMFIRLSSILIDKTLGDKNRVQYIVFPKTKVLIAKTTIDVFLFLVTILTSIIGSTLIIYFWKEGQLASDFVFNVFVFIVSIGLFYLLIATGLRMIISGHKLKNKQKVIIALLWIMLTLVTYITLSITMGLVSYKEYGSHYPKGFIKIRPVRNFFNDNIKWVSFIPILNFGVISSVLYGFTKWYWITPFIFQSLLFFALTIKPLSRNFKQFLTT